MSKAFTKEADEGPFEDLVPEPKDLLPAGVRNYVTPEGADALRGELRRLEEEVRPSVEGEDPDSKRKLAAVDRRLRFLQERVANMEIVDPAMQEKDSVRFGARVTVADENGDERVYKIVGVDESDPSRGKISWISPIAKALISARIGDVVVIELPDGNVELEVLEIEYR
jgi:transcription elongation factor GreB